MSSYKRPFRRGAFLLSIIFAVLLVGVGAGAAQARDAFVVISGGGDPQGNNYSQYLSARAYTNFLRSRYPEDSIWVFFGAGNVTGKPPLIADVIQTVKDANGRNRTTFIPGALLGNRPARREEIARAFRDEILPAVREGGTLYLFVGDHGSPSGPHGGADDFPESVITLWQWDRDPTHPHGWRDYVSPTESLGVAQLRRWLSEGLGRGRVVFTMSQCYSGGFHYLGIPRQVTPDLRWFTRTPGWVTQVKETDGMPLVAGFTATDDVSLASGCTPDVEADRWAGYERYLPEQLVGFDVFTLKPAGVVRNSLYAAHAEAALVDQTIDKPRSTSEQYLHVWAKTIERVAQEKDVRSDIRQHLERFRDTLNGKSVQSKDPALLERQAEFKRLIDRMVAENSSLKDLPSLTQEKLEEAASKAEPHSHSHNHSQGKHEPLVDMKVANDLWNKQIAPAWLKAVEAGEVPELEKPVAAYELDVAKYEASTPASGGHGHDHELQARGRGVSPTMAGYWHSGYGDPKSFEDARAKMIDDWSRARKRRILDWAKQSGDPKVRAAAQVCELTYPPSTLDPNYVAPDAHESEEGDKKEERPSGSTAAARIQFYRQVLGAWDFLIGVNEREALARVKALTDLERTALPKGR